MCPQSLVGYWVKAYTELMPGWLVHLALMQSGHTAVDSWAGGPRATMEAANNEIVAVPNIEQTRVVYVDGQLLLKYVERRLGRGDHFKDVAETLGIGRNILRRRLQLLGWRGVYDTPNVVSGDVIEAIRSEVPVMRAGVNWGIRSVQCRLRLSGLRVGRQAVRDALYTMHPDHMERRQLGRLRRGQYTITKPMILWHMDSYDKLAKWGIKIHAGIDGGTHFVLWARAAVDKRQTTIYDAYADAVRRYGRPLRLRSDFAAEHNMVEADMRRGRPNIFRPFLRGSSVHNQRIEHFWRQVWTHLIFYYKHLLTLMGRHGFLNLVNPVQKASMVAVFLPAIQQDLANFVATWNVHRVRKINQNGRHLAGHVPDCMFQSWEREMGLVLPPTVDDDPWNMEDSGHDDLEVNRRPYAPDPPQSSSLLAEDIENVRDAAYMIGAAGMRGSLQRMYNLHVALTYECLHYVEEGAPDIQTHCHMVMSREALPADRLTTCRLLQAALQRRDSSLSG